MIQIEMVRFQKTPLSGADSQPSSTSHILFPQSMELATPRSQPGSSSAMASSRGANKYRARHFS
jgi:hypothetical protein